MQIDSFSLQVYQMLFTAMFLGQTCVVRQRGWNNVDKGRHLVADDVIILLNFMWKGM